MMATTEVGVGYVRLLPSMAGFSTAVQAEMAGAGAGLATTMGAAGAAAGVTFRTRFSEALIGSGKWLSRTGTKMSLLLTAPLLLLGTKAVQGASDLNESLNKSNVVFKDSAKVIENWASGTADSIGVSKRAALDAAGGFGNMFTQLGFGTDQTAGMSMDMVKLAADFASFHNADITDVLEAQSAAFRGEYDSVQRFLPLMSAANVEAEAMRETGKKNAKQLTAGEKAQAAFNLMIRDAGPALGDFARTADQDANATRRMEARAQDASDTLGQKLLPVKRKLVSIIGTLADKFNQLSPFMQKVVLAGVLLVAALGPIFTVLGPIVQVIGFLVGANPVVLAIIGAFIALAAVGILVYRNWSTVKKWIDVVWQALQQFWGWLKTQWAVIGPILIGAFKGFVDWVKSTWSTIGPILIGAVSGIIGFFQGMWRTATRIWDWFSGTFGPGFLRVFKSLWVNIPPIIREIGETIMAFKGYWDKIYPVIAGIVSGIVQIFQWMSDRIITIWDMIAPFVIFAINTLVGAIKLGLGAVLAVWSAIWGFIGDYIVIVFNLITRIISNAIAIISNIIQFVLNILQGDWGQAWDNAANIVRVIWDTIGAIIRAAWETIWAIVRAAIDLVMGLFSELKDWAGGRIDDIIGFFRGIWGNISGAMGSIKDGVMAAFTAIKDWVSGIVDDIVGFFEGLPGRVGRAIEGIADKITGPFDSAIGAIKKGWNATLGGFGFSFSLPSWLGGHSFSLRIPSMHSGGIFMPPGYRTEGLALLQRGEGVFTPEQMRAIGARNQPPTAETRTVVEIHADGLDRTLLEWLRKSVRARGGNVQTTLGTAR